MATIACPSKQHHLAEYYSLTIGGSLALGLGVSLVAIALAAWMVAKQVFGINIADVVEALRGASPLVRSEQVIDIHLKDVNGGVRINAEHRFGLMASGLSRKAQLRLFTDSGTRGGGFLSIDGPGGVLEGADLEKRYYVRDEEGKPQFRNTYPVSHKTPAQFVISTYAEMRTSDRLVWTVEHISVDFSVRIHDEREPPGNVQVKINHHHASQISDAITKRRAGDGPVLEFTFLGPVLPFQGFELQWSPGSSSDVASPDPPITT